MLDSDRERGFYFQFLKQDILKKDIWAPDKVVFAKSINCAAKLFVECHCQEKDYIHSIHKNSNDEYEVIIRGEHNFECKYKAVNYLELDLEIPAFLR